MKARRIKTVQTAVFSYRIFTTLPSEHRAMEEHWYDLITAVLTAIAVIGSIANLAVIFVIARNRKVILSFMTKFIKKLQILSFSHSIRLPLSIGLFLYSYGKDNAY